MTKPLKSVLTVVCLVAVGVGVLVGAAEAQSTTPSPTDELVPIRIVTIRGAALNLIPNNIAERLDFFAAHGLAPEFIYTRGGSEAATALLSGSVDFGVFSIENVVKARLQGKELRMVALINQYPGMALVVRENLRGQVNTVKDLKGRRVAITSSGGASDLTLTFILKQHGLAKTDIKVVSTGLAGVVAALESGQVDAGMSFEPFTTQLDRRGVAFPLIDLNTKEQSEKLYHGRYAQAGLITRSEILTEKPDLVRAAVAAYRDALHWMAEHSPEEIMSHLPQEMREDEESLLAALHRQRDLFPADVVIELDAIQNVLRTFEAFGLVESTTPQISPDTLFDNSFASASKGAGETKGIGPVSPEAENARYLWYAYILVTLLIIVLVGWYVAHRRLPKSTD